MREELIKQITDLINERISEIDFVQTDTVSSIDSFLLNTAIRLSKAYLGYKNGTKGKSDFYVSLRNFMLVFHTPLFIDSIEIDKDNKFGIIRVNDNNEYQAFYDVDHLVDHKKFIEDAYITKDTVEESIKSKYQLKTNGYIKKLTGFNYFKSEEQKLCVYGGLNTPEGYTTLISMPTGGGKSLVTQTLAYEKNGLSIVVVPTVSLAIDQERVAKKNIKIAKENEIFCYYSGVKNYDEILNAIKNKTAKLLFISPESLIRNEQFQKLINEANNTRYIKNIVIDEAHIVVSWGDYFRVDYQCLGPWRRDLIKTNPSIRTYLLSATFTDDTVSILKRMFTTNGKWLEIRCDSLRHEPRYILKKAKSNYQKKMNALEFVNKLPRPLIIYVDSPYSAEQWKRYLVDNGYNDVKMFTGSTKTEQRLELIEGWAENDFDLMIATSAFGVGVDKPDVRSVLHLYVPENPDAYYQELGRGGRDGLPSLSVMCIEMDDIRLGSKHVTRVLTKDTFWGRWWSMYTNPSNQWQSGLIAIMSSTKPNYNRSNSFEEGNETDEKWNINVLLLLNRNRLIDICGITLDNQNRYIFTIKILNDLLMRDTEEARLFFEELRNKEALKAQSAFNLIRDSINKADTLCWSNMFFSTYPLVSEYCAGCNYDTKTVAEDLGRFPLLMSISGPAKKLSQDNETFFGDTHEALVISDDCLLKSIEKYKPDVIVCDDEIDLDQITKLDVNHMNFTEFLDLQTHDNEFYISGLVMACYSEEIEQARKQYQIVRKYLNGRRYVIHISKNDFIVSDFTGKTISEYIVGTVEK